MPMKLEIPLSNAMPLSDTTLPKANSFLFIGVTSKVAMVPRSFSPAMALGAIPITPLKSSIRISIGMSLERTLPSTSSWLAMSNWSSTDSMRLMSKRLLNCSS